MSTPQRPSLGRIVLVPMDPADNNGAPVAPAIIVRVWSDDMVNVRILGDNKTEEWRTSVKLVDTIPDWADDGHAPNVWAWPPRV